MLLHFSSSDDILSSRNDRKEAILENDRRQIALNATKEEIKLFELIKAFHQRKSDSDMIRFLIVQEAGKILPKTSSADDK